MLIERCCLVRGEKMESKEYLKLCKANAVFPNSKKVVCEGVEYFPKDLRIWFDNHGEMRRTAYMQEANGSFSFVSANLQKVLDK